ncbi:unnamed protein product [Rhizophagus irregularis]|nr:unnamed protein product [Rhizophagus irregularis]
MTDNELKYQIMTFLLAGHETTNITIIKETLRLNPPVLVTSRLSTKDEVFGGYHVPKNTVIMIPFSILHRLPEIWGPTAAEFDPKRCL